MSALAQQISAVEAQLQAAWARKDGAAAKRLKAELDRLWAVRRESLARSRNDGSWAYTDPAAFRRRAR